jgi:hypothetical protein
MPCQRTGGLILDELGLGGYSWKESVLSLLCRRMAASVYGTSESSAWYSLPRRYS